MIYFKELDYYCPCGCGLDFEDMDEDFIKDADRARGYAEVPFIYTSTIRCMEYNLNPTVGGSKTSSHVKGLAGDIKCESSYARYRILYGLKKAGFTRIGIGKNFIHFDSDSDKPKELIWIY